MPPRESPAVRTNRLAWDRTVRRHRLHRGDETERLRRGEDPSDLTAMGGEALRALGDLRGRDVLHLLCNHGAASVALARRCRSLVGVDLSPEAVADARALARDTGSAARFVEAEVLRHLESTRRRADVVIALWGVTCWIPDLGRFARGVARVLRPGGALCIVDGHPMANSSVGVGRPGDGYFPPRPGAPIRERWTLDYVGPGDGVAVDIVWWQWTIGDLVTACADAGLVVEELREHAGTHPEYYGAEIPLVAEDGAGHLPGRRGTIPLAFTLRARRPAARRMSGSAHRSTAVRASPNLRKSGAGRRKRRS